MGNDQLADLFDVHLPAPPPAPKPTPKAAVEDIGLRDEKIGLGFPGEKLDLVCPECSSLLRLRTSKHGLFYGCQRYPECTASHGANNDGSPKGIPGNKETRKARIQTHRIFDRLWSAKADEKPMMSRSQAYTWLRRAMKMSESDAHIGKFSVAECERAMALTKKKYPGVQTAWDRISADEDPF